MGLVIGISKKVDLEMRRDSFLLHVDGFVGHANESPEFLYDDVADLLAALTKVTKEARYLDYMGTKLQKKKT